MNWNFININFIIKSGHFTQVIWKGSQEAGFGRAKAADNAWYVVGRYLPAGNFLGQYKENIPPLPNGRKKTCFLELI